jgi:hypothetical protein
MDGVDQLICCSVEGDIKGYKAMPAHLIDMNSDRNVSQEAIRDMAQRKQNLLLELTNLKEASKPAVERKFDEYGGQSTGIPVRKIQKIFKFQILKNINYFDLKG